MSVVFALEDLFDEIQQNFAEESSSKSVLDLGLYSGTSVPALIGTPTADADVRVIFPSGGVVGVPGIVYAVSTDGGTTFGPNTPLGSATSLSVLGVTLSLSAPGTVVSNDAVSWTQTGPAVVTLFSFGWREPTYHTSFEYRVVFTPGWEGSVGELVDPLKVGGNPRSLADLQERFTILLEACDTSDPQNERKQYNAGRRLLDAMLRMLLNAANGLVQLGETTWLGIGDTLGAVSTDGVAIKMLCSLRSPVPDVVFSTAPATAAAKVRTTTVVEDDDSDQTDQDSITRSDTP